MIIDSLLEVLDKLSYKTTLDKSLKNTLRKFDKDELINDIKSYRRFLNKNVGLLIGYEYRIKAMQSIVLKYEKYYPSKEVYGCFNDILGIRIIVNNYNDINLQSDMIRCVDMREGKSNDDGYRGVHAYYHKSKYHYPIEMQFFTEEDFRFNIWLHKYVYKYKDNKIGTELRKLYDINKISKEDEFVRCLENVLSNSEGF